MRLVDSAVEALEEIQSGEFIWCHSMAATPTRLLEGLAEHARSRRDLTLMQLHLEHAETVTDPSLDGHLRHRCFFAARRALSASRASRRLFR